jgi:CheY-like chemotaxis protein
VTEFRQYGEQSSPKPILLVDDNEQLREIMARALDEAGYIVLQATDGPEALDVLAVGPQIQLLITDIAMPRMNGVQLASHFMAASHVPVLFISGNPHEPAELPGPILQKPFTPEILVATVKRLLAIMGLHANPM